MILENSDKLKDWLSVVLEPLCDADSSALARYVIALLKKDKSDKDLKRIMIEQLDVFLSEETTRFVDRLFDAIASEEYLTNPAPMPASMAATSSSVAELELEHDLDGIADLEAVLAAASSPPPPPPKDNVIKPDGNQQQQNNESSREPASESQSSMPGNSVSATATDAPQSTTGTHSTKPAFDHKTKDSYSSHQQQQITHHHHHSGSSSSGAVAGGFVRSASPPMRSSGGSNPAGGAYAADKENQPRDSRRRRASLRSRSRSRSRSNDRSFRRSRSRDRRVNEREKSQRQFRNKSPPGGASDQRHRRNNNNNNNNSNNSSFDRRRIGNSNNSNSNMDERGQRFGGNKGRHSPRSRSNSPETRNTRRGNNVEPIAGSSASAAGAAVPVPPPVVHSVAPVRQRCRDFDEKGYCVRGETCPWDHGINPVVFEGINNSALMMSMREYNPDAPEIWARGGPAGVPGVAGAGAGSQPPLPGPPQPGQSSINPFSGNVRACAPLGVPNPADYSRQPGQVPPVPAPPPMMPFPFNPTAVTTPLQRQLIPIPVMDGGAGGIAGGIPAEMGKRRFELEDSVAIADVPSKMRKVPINSRLGPRVNPNMQQHNSSLELRKVPRGLNTIAHLNNHFAKFGKIVNIQVSYEGDPEAAIVTFSTHAEANVAYRSTEAVLNNRFIKVFWHNDNNSSGGGGGVGNSNANNNESGNLNVNRKSQYHLHNVPAVPTPNADSAKISNNGNLTTPLGEAGSTNNNAAGITPTSSDQALASTAAPASMRLKLNTSAAAAGNTAANGAAARGLTPAANAASIRKKQEEQQKAMHQLANGLRKRKQELLQSYVKQMKTALELVERMDLQDVQRAPTLETIKVLQATIDKLRKDVHADQDQLQAQIQQQQQQQQQQLQPQAVKKTKEQQKKELLDMELELIAQQQEGNDTTAIQKRLEELQRTLSGTGGGPLGTAGGGGTKPAGGGARKRATFPEGSTRVDRRPKAIVVTGFAAEEADFVLGHFKHFGEISKHDVDREIPQLILSYATRINAEQAVLRGKIYKDKRLQISWAPVVTKPAAVPMGAPADKLASSIISPLSNAAGDKLDNPKQLMQSVSESESLLGSDTLPELRLEDEEEDEESEDRSWRR
ncbi:zinc finger protein swm [Drosophila albomicans]|uniref:Zinc finger protein swm n=1 Tax=Drosophila albomicans TaxID=7291 RepID=A0A6P8W7G6_DROAB|nr:zinc finger protein swm [Drosophila albomicans]